MSDKTEITNIRMHFEQLLTPDQQARFGIYIGVDTDPQEAHMAVFRALTVLRELDEATGHKASYVGRHKWAENLKHAHARLMRQRKELRRVNRTVQQWVRTADAFMRDTHALRAERDAARNGFWTVTDERPASKSLLQRLFR